MTEEKSQKIINYIKDLVEIPSPTGFTGRIKDYLVENAKLKGIKYMVTRKGAVIYTFSKDDKPGVMFAAHIDTLGAMVKEIRENSLKVTSVGGYPFLYVIGDYCKIHAEDGIYDGTFLPVNPAVHVSKDVYEMKANADNVEIRVDYKKADKEDSLKKHINIGNFISFDPKFRYVNGFVKTRHLDDKASAGVLLFIADELNEGVIKTERNISIFFNVTEETGQGVAGYPPFEDLIIVDMGVVGDGVAGDEFSVSICAKDSSGPYNYELTQELISVAKQNSLAYKVDVFPYYGSDGSAVLASGYDARVALIGPGIGASHGYERTHEEALISSELLIRKYLEK